MKVVGLTGGIGSGKTTVAKMFRNLGVPVFIADIEGKRIMQNSIPVRKEIIKTFGPESFEGDEPNRSFLANVVFADDDKLEKLNNIIHPEVAAAFLKWRKEQNYNYVLYEAAILFETGSHHKCDYTIVVTAPEDVRISRVVERDQTSESHVRLRMQKQWSDDQKKKMADFVIENINLQIVEQEVERLHQFFTQSS